MTERDALADEIALRRRSLEDARGEHARGELDDDALRGIEHREVPLLEAAEARLAALGDEASEHAVDDVEPDLERHTRSRRLLVGLCASLLVIAVVLVLVIAKPFSSSPPAPKLSLQGQITVLNLAAESELAYGRTLRAITVYDAVLKLDPHNAEALVESAWLHYELALRSGDKRGADAAAAALGRTIVILPNDSAAHLYDGIVLYQHDHNRAAALVQILRSAALPESPVEQSLTGELLAVLRPTGR